LELYRKVYEDLLAVPVIKGKKSEKEKFAGAWYTTSLEAFVTKSGRGVQAATSHCLGQNLAKMFGIEFSDDENGKKSFVWQNSWGLTTRSLGVMVMTHGDNRGVVLPPMVAPIQTVIVPIIMTSMNPTDRDQLLAKARDLADALNKETIRVKVDDRTNYSPGWKYNHYELKGVPLRIEIGPKDMLKQFVVIVRRDTGEKLSAPWENLVLTVKNLLKQVQESLYSRAMEERDKNIEKIFDWEKFVPSLDNKKMIKTPWCDSVQCEEKVKVRSGEGGSSAAKTLCIPLEQDTLDNGTKCFSCGQPATVWALWGRTY